MGQAWGLVVAVTLSAWLVVLAAFDIRCRRLPNLLTVPGAAVILAGAALAGQGHAAALGAAALFAVYATVHLVAPAAMGAGDVRLALGVGALTGALGPAAWVVATLAAAALTVMWAGVLAACRTGASVPHGVSMCVGAAVVTLPVLC